MTIADIINIAESHQFIVREYKEKGVVCGYEFETWTDSGVNMIELADCRDYADGATVENILEEIKDRAAHFDVDGEIDSHRCADDYRQAFTIRESLLDFEDYNRRLTEFVRALQAAYDGAA